jgi:hypothetical protein
MLDYLSLKYKSLMSHIHLPEVTLISLPNKQYSIHRKKITQNQIHVFVYIFTHKPTLIFCF